MPRIWDEDQLFPRIYGVGFMRGDPAPGGSIYHVDLDGKNWELVSSGFRNTFDAAFNAEGELFTYDADMEWDMGAPWYRPTRVCHVVSGADWGWRNGSAKWPPYWADTVPPVVEVGPGSPTGMTFGYGAKFPAKYQKALFMCDWSYGKLYALHLVPRGGSFAGTIEEFVTATPLASHRRHHQPARRRDVLSDRRPRRPIGTVPSHVRRQGIDRASRREDAADER